VDERKGKDQADGARKAAVVLLSLDRQASAEILKKLPEQEVERIASEMANLGSISPEIRKQALGEFTAGLVASARSASGGVDRAEALLESALGKARAGNIVDKLRKASVTGPAGRLGQVAPDAVVEILKNEHPQMIALILSRLEPETSGGLLASLPDERRCDVALRIATMGEVAPDTAEEVQRVVSSQLEGVAAPEVRSTGGAKRLADILNMSDRELEKEVLEFITTRDMEIATEIKHSMFSFDDICLLDDRSLQRVLREVDSRELAVALKAADDKIKAKIFKNMSERASAMIKEEIEYMGPKRLSEVEEAQQHVIDAVRALEESGDIVIPGKGRKGDDVIV
jgi:flagellar motor switch protein FliG